MYDFSDRSCEPISPEEINWIFGEPPTGIRSPQRSSLKTSLGSQLPRNSLFFCDTDSPGFGYKTSPGFTRYQSQPSIPSFVSLNADKQQHTSLFDTTKLSERLSESENFAANLGTSIAKYRVTLQKEVLFSFTREGDKKVHGAVNCQCITGMEEYSNKSVEELRLEDYAANRNKPLRVAPGSLFGCSQHLHAAFKAKHQPAMASPLGSPLHSSAQQPLDTSNPIKYTFDEQPVAFVLQNRNDLIPIYSLQRRSLIREVPQNTFGSPVNALGSPASLNRAVPAQSLSHFSSTLTPSRCNLATATTVPGFDGVQQFFSRFQNDHSEGYKPAVKPKTSRKLSARVRFSNHQSPLPTRRSFRIANQSNASDEEAIPAGQLSSTSAFCEPKRPAASPSEFFFQKPAPVVQSPKATKADK